MPGTTEDIEDTDRTEHCNRPLRSSAHSAVRNELISSRPQFALTRVLLPAAGGGVLAGSRRVVNHLILPVKR